MYRRCYYTKPKLDTSLIINKEFTSLIFVVLISQHLIAIFSAFSRE